MSKRALVAEPDLRFAAVLDGLLRHRGYDVVRVRDGAEALTAIAAGAPDVLIANLSMPRVDGFALLRELRKTISPARTLAIVASGSMQLRTTASKLRDELGIAAVVAVGMSVESLARAIARATGDSEPSRVVAARPRPPAAESHSHPRRLAHIQAMGLVDDLPPDEELQALVRDTAQTFDVPIALVSIVLGDTQWFKAHVGLGGDLLADRGTPIQQSFCRHVVEGDTHEPLVVPDATTHPLFANNALVTGGTVGSYAGAPLLTPEGHVLGSLCIIDTKPLAIDAEQVDLLTGLARRLAGELELRSKARKAETELAALRQTIADARPDPLSGSLDYLDAFLSSVDVGMMVMSDERRVLYANRALAEMFGITRAALASLTRDQLVQHVATLSDDPDDVRRRMHVLASGPFLAREELEIARPVRRVLRWVAKPVRLPTGIAQVATFTDITVEHDLLRDAELTFEVELAE